ncbi:CBM96 family carbohydrate-binding protein [Dyadobacter sandarakinus]|uniref:DNRLRE domain-containing protein n=1 Tax=Dyadobacter sandarakinus TaxID=2747268 RepID=A0ABX7I5Q7_9BACT|nr:DNRLRE domain-containing protein [Dyadobacter sandarakinus]QRR01434.1 DNRLRE domain-containing protein [Dyadobacter sandarakinus]
MRQFFLRLQFLMLCLSLSASLFAQPAIQWQRTLGGSDEEYVRSVIQTADGGYLLSGRSASPAGFDKSDSLRGRVDAWIVKLNAAGEKEWDKTLGGIYGDDLGKVAQTPDGGYFLAGASYPGGGGDKAETSETGELWVVKLNATGNILWQKQLGVENYYNAGVRDMKMLPDGGFILAVGAQDIGGYDNLNQAFLMRLSADAKVQWVKRYDGLQPRDAVSVQCVSLTSDGGFVLGLETTYFEDHPDVYHIVKTDAQGIVQWKRVLGVLEDGQASVVRSVSQTRDGGYIVGGTSKALAFSEKSERSLSTDYWVVKLDRSGQKIEWEKTIQADRPENLIDVLELADGFVVVGDSESSNTGGLDKTEPNRGVLSTWLVKLSNAGQIMWDKTLGGSFYDTPNASTATRDGGFVFVANSASPVSGDKTEPSRGGADYWIVKLAPENLPLPQTTLRINAGGPDFTTATKKLFIADKYYAGTDRTSSIASGDILGTTNDVLYRSARSAPSFSYNIPVQNGQVNVTLHFAETYFGVPGTKGEKGGTSSRRFHVNMEGSRILTNYDIFAQAGGALRANQVTFPVMVTDGILNIDFLTGAADQPRVSAIEVISTGLNLAPVADTYIQAAQFLNTNFGTSSTFEVKYSSGDISKRRASYLKFQLPAQTPVISAKLRVYGHNHENNKGILLHAYGVNDDSWTETGITKQNAPAASTASLGFVAVNDVYQYYEIDVTSFVKAQQQSGETLVSLLLNDPSNQNTRLIFNSKEAGSNFPQLVIQTTNSSARLGEEEVLVESKDKQPSIVFPNPVKDHFTVSLSPEHAGPISFEMINAAGKSRSVPAPQNIKPGENTELNISGESFHTGIYLLKVKSDAFTEVVKVLVAE